MGVNTSIEQDTTQKILKDIRNLLASANSGNAFTAVPSSYQTISLTNSTVVRLTVPVTASSAEITLDTPNASASTNANSGARYTVDGTTPVTGTASASTHGVPIGDFDTLVIVGNTNLVNFRAIANDAVSTKYLRVQYYT